MHWLPKITIEYTCILLSNVSVTPFYLPPAIYDFEIPFSEKFDENNFHHSLSNCFTLFKSRYHKILLLSLFQEMFQISQPASRPYILWWSHSGSLAWCNLISWFNLIFFLTVSVCMQTWANKSARNVFYTYNMYLEPSTGIQMSIV